MSHTMALFRACHDLFISYPLAVRVVNENDTIRSMVLMLRDGDEAEFFVLSEGCGGDMPVYSLCRWPAGDVVDVDPDGSAQVPEVLANAVTFGIPLPRHGSMCGWTWGGLITAVVVIYTDSGQGRPLPRWAVMPLAGVPESQWPSFTGRHFFGPWFWEEYQAGSIVFLDSLIAANPGTVFWVNTQAILGSDCCAVARNIRDRDGHALRRGRYVYSEALRSGVPIPSLTALLADASKIDMAPRLRRPVPRDGWSCIRT